MRIEEASKVVPVDKMSVVITIILAMIFLHESITVKSAIGCLLIAVGTLLFPLACKPAILGFFLSQF